MIHGVMNISYEARRRFSLSLGMKTFRRNFREVYLNAKPSVLHEALVPLKIRTLAV